MAALRRIQGAPTVPVVTGARAELRAVPYVEDGGRRSPTLTLWSPGDVTYQSWRPYWSDR